MSQARAFSLIGDSNIQRNMGSLNCRYRPLMSNAQVIPCGRLDILPEALSQVRAETNVCVHLCIANFITRSEGSSTSPSLRIEPVLGQFLHCIEASALANETGLFLITPPTYRTFPVWYS